MMRRRDFITLLGGAAAWPVAAHAQKPPIVGFLSAAAPEAFASLLAVFRRGLQETGYVEGQNVRIEYRWATGRNDRLPDLAADLVSRNPAVLVTAGSTPAALAAQAATSSIPIVFSIGSDPVELGLVRSFSRPGGNLTGITLLTTAIAPKRLQLLQMLAPGTKRIVMLVKPDNPFTLAEHRQVFAAGKILGMDIAAIGANDEKEIEEAFGEVSRIRPDALLVSAEPYFLSRRDQLAALTLRYRVVTMFHRREFVVVGGLISYGDDLPFVYRQLGTYVGRILAGTNVADLPVMQPTKFELALNQRTAKTLGLDIPPTLLALADEVIE